ncbi:MAG: hypothetical protein KDI65_11115 [Alphaproteobacteria bacterium]|nr:hypothetical protein [Alphaproteobacteria bacterium]
MDGPALRLHFSPYIDEVWLIVFAVAGALFVAAAFWRTRRALVFRAVTLALFILILMNPSLLSEERKGVSDVAVVVVDRSASQTMGKRTERTDRALASVKEQLEEIDGLDLRIIEAPETGSLENRTKLFDVLDPAFASIPQQRRAGVIFISDGQIHDVPQNAGQFTQYGPVSVLLSGERNEKDRQIVITNAPSYGLVGQSVDVKYKIEDTRNIGASSAVVTFTRHDGSTERFNVPVNTEQTLSLPIENSGQNVFEIEVQKVDGELTYANNKAALLVNGVRDRLRVLLVSGKPHAGGRTWRDLLTSDPGVDLVHFTILREPQKLDLTPQDELSLIAFPFRELFEIKLYDFDLIIFDRYHLNRILPNMYFDNIAKYVEEGGAFLEASGPSFAGEDSIYMTSLMSILPGSPTGDVIDRPFKPTPTDLGRRHPVTDSLVWGDYHSKDKGVPSWGRWLRQVDLHRESGDVLMNGVDGKPLLILDRVKKGRVAQIASDQIWLWSRGFESGGPHAELLRRVVHWLMKEPELDERALSVLVDRNTIIVRKHIYDQDKETIKMTTPDGQSSTFNLTSTPEGWLEHKVSASALGIYAFEDSSGERRYAIIGDINPPELFSVKTTSEKLEPVLTASKGGAVWLSDVPEPRVRLLSNSRNYAGNNWVGLRRNNDYTVTGVKDIPLMPEWMSLLLLFCVLTFAWWREGQFK